VVAVILILPLTDLLVSLVTRMVADDKAPESALTTFYLDDNFLASPPIAVQQVKSEIMGMAGIAMRNFEAAVKMVRTSDYADRTTFDQNEEELNYLNREIARYASKLFSGQLSEADSEYLSSALKSISDLERVGDYSKHIVEYGEELLAQGDRFSDTALEEIGLLGDMVETIFGQTMRAYENEDEQEVVNAGVTELAISDQVAEMSANHAHRISEGKCSPDAGANYLALVSDVERVGAHFYNMAKTVRGL
jgi:phosphate:Na+ symporter